MRVPIELDLHLANFNYPGVGPDELFDKIAEIATSAEESGFTAVSVMDHLHQIVPVGIEENFMLEGNTILAGIAARTSTIAMGLLVGGVTYRNPALHAKVTTTVDIISGGRAFHGIGAAWFEGEHRAYGFDFPPLKERFERLEDHLRIARAMFAQERATVDGTRQSAAGALNNPKPVRGDIPILIGGSGERKTLRMVAQYADGCNVFGDPTRVRHLLDVLEEHCDRLGRDPAEITKTTMATIAIGETEEAARAKLDLMRELGVPEERVASFTVGTPDRLRELAESYRAVGIEGLTIRMPDAHDPEAVALVGETLAPVFTGSRAT